MADQKQVDEHPKAAALAEYLTRKESAARAAVTVKTWDKYARDPRAPPPLVYSRRLFWTAQQVDQIVELKTQPKPARKAR